jgi:transglutaminase-like putative cysteine protease
MESLFRWLLRRLRPRVGWLLAGLALGAALCPALAAAESPLRLPARVVFWAGLIGLLLGMRSARGPIGDDQGQEAGDRRPVDGRPSAGASHPPHAAAHTGRHAVQSAFWAGLSAIGGVLLILAIDGALPPLGLVLQDLGALFAWAGRALQPAATVEAPPASRAWAFLGESIPRAWGELAAAPNAGESGARLLVATAGVVLTWGGTLALGHALARGSPTLGWGLPLLAAIALITILGAGTGVPLVVGTFLLLLLAAITDFQRRERAWERRGTDFSTELRRDVLVWGSTLIGAALAVALLLPAWLTNPIAEALWRDIEAPSGLAALERTMQLGGRRPPTADVGLSQLPALELGLSLEQAPPDEVALRVQLAAPLPDSLWPHYWRARVLNLYSGRSWTTDARVSPQEPGSLLDTPFPGAIVQEVEDAFPDRQLVIGLPDVLDVSIPTNAERLADGTLVALTEREPATHYRVVSRLQEFAAPPPPDGPPPDMSAYLGLPGDLPPRVMELARAIVGDRSSAYARALALEEYLRALPYRYQVQPLPRAGDAVDQFLFDMRQGYCTYYASAMAIMARSLGIPARVATGYFTGTYDRSSATYIVHEADAHAWPELYIDGRWMPFEPTPIRPLPARADREAPPPPAPVPMLEQPRPGPAGPLIWLVVFGLIVLLSAAGIWLGRRVAPAPLVARVHRQLERQGARIGVAWPPGATLHEYGALLEPYMDGAVGALYETIALIEQARYGGRPLHEDEQRRLRAAGEQVRQQLGQATRRR